MAVGPSLDEYTGAGRNAVLGVCAVTVAALLVRLVDLGGRVAHWDEGRVGYWILDYVRTGEMSYRPIIHGPFYHHVNPLVFDVFGPTDFAMRLVPALVTGLLPLSVLLLCDRFDGVELVGMAFFFAFNPLLLYYSRFMRGDPLVGAFMMVAFFLFVRFYDTRLYRHLFAAVAFTALGFTVKENAPVYVLCWLGGLTVYGVLVLFASSGTGRRLLQGRLGGVVRLGDRRPRPTWSGPLADGGAGVRRVLPRPSSAGALLGVGVFLCCLVLFFAIVVAFYAPRGATGVTVSTTLADPTRFPALVREATVGSVESFYSLWLHDGGQSDHPYPPYLEHLVETLGAGAVVVSLLAFVGVGADSTREGGPRPVVLVTFLWGLASVFGYPLITDIKAPWAATHVVFPWVVPAGAGIVRVVRWGRSVGPTSEVRWTFPVAVVAAVAVGRSWFDFGVTDAVFWLVVAAVVAVWALGLVARRGKAPAADYLTVGLALTVVLFTAVVPVATAYQTSFAQPQAESNDLVQYAQPSAEVHPEMAAIEALAERNEGTDVVLYGSSLVDGNPIRQEPSCAGHEGWFDALPLPWYLEGADAETACAQNLGALNAIESEGTPPVVVSTVSHRRALEERYPDYTVTVRSMRLYGSEWVFLVDTSRLPAEENPLAGVDDATVAGRSSVTADDTRAATAFHHG
ncbi:flippase activity-associated protein Agl23 [Halomarina oriensis]|uniref:TIGR03663 family protein n=1 Tax=Halomarina oriensis TaxID=671145 RepID=A0A6B0GIT5_9EURY|nr:flippase activity-associated protein Agl23 [Halomarina oriensis]MWG33379.1 TIGR03663 family protein [Halomarina oriensis]